MAKFSLQRVLELKQRKEQTLAIRLAHTRTLADEARQRAEQIEEQRRESEAQLHAGNDSTRTVGSLQNASYVLARLDQQLAEARKTVKTAQAEADACLAEFTIALQERQVLDRLKEKRLHSATLEENRLEQASTDDIALSRFVRREPIATGGNT